MFSVEPAPEFPTHPSQAVGASTYGNRSPPGPLDAEVCQPVQYRRGGRPRPDSDAAAITVCVCVCAAAIVPRTTLLLRILPVTHRDLLWVRFKVCPMIALVGVLRVLLVLLAALDDLAGLLQSLALVLVPLGDPTA